MQSNILTLTLLESENNEVKKATKYYKQQNWKDFHPQDDKNLDGKKKLYLDDTIW